MSKEDIRKQILTLSQGKKHSFKEISSIIGVNRTTVWRVIKRHNSSGTFSHRKGGGRPAKLHLSVKYKCAKYINSEAQKPVREIAKDIEAKHGISVSKSTIHRTLQKMDYSKPFPSLVPMLSEKNRLKRIEWAQRNENKHWCHAIFSDEASFWLHARKVRMWTKGSKKRVIPSVKHSSKVHIWAAFSSVGTFPLCIFSQNLDAAFFVKILEWHLLANAEVYHAKRWFLIQDNDPKHTSKLAKKWMSDNIPNNVLDWPSQSPDLNPIENIFAWMKNQLNRNRPRKIADLKTRLEEIWDSITPEFLKPYYKSMRRRCELCIRNNGYKINY